MTIWHFILMAWMAWQLFSVARSCLKEMETTEHPSTAIVSFVIASGFWFLLLMAMIKCGLLDGIGIGAARIR